jgi:archaemetzincin
MREEGMERKIILLPIGSVEAGTLVHLNTTLEKEFKCVCLTGSAIPIPPEAFNLSLKKYLGHRILARLPIPELGYVLGVADLDLYVPGLNFIFGLADYRTRRAVIALPRLRQTFYGSPDELELFLPRAAKEAVHEMGHLYGLEHCQDRRCVMAFSNSLADTDYKNQGFCPRCVQKILM